jgi:hypothetical protein
VKKEKQEVKQASALDSLLGIFSSLLPGLNGHLNTALIAWCRALEVGEQVGNVVPRMSVQTSPQPLLVKVVRNETD